MRKQYFRRLNSEYLYKIGNHFVDTNNCLCVGITYFTMDFLKQEHTSVQSPETQVFTWWSHPNVMLSDI